MAKQMIVNGLFGQRPSPLLKLLPHELHGSLLRGLREIPRLVGRGGLMILVIATDFNRPSIAIVRGRVHTLEAT